MFAPVHMRVKMKAKPGIFFPYCFLQGLSVKLGFTNSAKLLGQRVRWILLLCSSLKLYPSNMFTLFMNVVSMVTNKRVEEIAGA